MKLKNLLLGEATSTHGSGPIDGKSKTNAKNWVLGKINKHTKGFYSDQYWTPIHAIWKDFDALRINWHMTESHYESEMITFSDGGRHSVPIRKIWSFEIDFLNNIGKDGKAAKIHGRITAAGAGSVEDPLDRYDVTVTLS